MMPLLVVDMVVLGMVGHHHPEGIWIPLGRIFTVLYFGHFIALPFVGLFETPLPLPESISTPVLPPRSSGGGGGPLPAGATAKPMEKN
jgi:ubiquinol-cytochrome c reductase cytochrome b subunit